MDINVINNSTPEGLRAFAEDVKNYCAEVEMQLKELIQTHKKIGEHWSGPQYDQFLERFELISKTIMVKINSLQEFRNQILIKAQELEEAQSIKLD